MVRKIFNFFIYLILFIVALIYFTPKISTYYFLEHTIKPFGVIISQERVSDNGLELKIENASISVKGVDSAVIENIDIQIFGLYNSFDIQNIELSSVASSFVPLKIEDLNIKYSVINPLFITGASHGEFGEASLNINILERTLQLKLIPSKIMKQKYRSTLRNLKKNAEGEYIYEKNI